MLSPRLNAAVAAAEGRGAEAAACGGQGVSAAKSLIAKRCYGLSHHQAIRGKKNLLFFTSRFSKLLMQI